MIEIRKEPDNSYRFKLKNANGNIILDSIPFADKKAIRKTISELTPLIHQPTIFERKTDYEGKFLFNLKNSKGQVIGSSPLFESEAGMENGIKNVKNRITALVADLGDL